MNKTNLFLISILIKFTLRRIFYKNKFIKNLSYKKKSKSLINLNIQKFKNKKDIKIKDYNEDVYPLF